VVFFLGFFLVLTNFLYSQSLLTALAMAVSVWGWLTALTLAHMPVGRPRLAEAGGLAARAALVGTPVMLALFLLFPRIGPLWALPGDGASTGLSDRLRLGDVAELAQDDSIALRLKLNGPALPPQALYFRGPVLSSYDGESWQVARNGPRRPALSQHDIALQGKPVDYEMTLEPLRIPWLPLLEFTPQLPNLPAGLEVLGTDDSGQWRLRVPLAERTRLQAQAWPAAQRGAHLSLLEQRALVALPPGRHPRTLAWAVELQRQPSLREADARSLAHAVLQHIRTADYRYTLSPGTYGRDAVDEFWLDRRAGFCEHFAAAFVVVMRALDVPARIVTGYQGVDARPVDGFLLVRQSNAHAWAEYWQPGEGWLRADPTAAVAPERIEGGRPLRAPPGFVMGALDNVSPGLRLRLREWVEALDNRWNQWVLGYGKRQQFDLLSELGMSTPDSSALLRLLALLLAGAALVGAVWAWRDARRRSPWQRLQARIEHELDRLDVAAPPSAGPGALARRVRAVHGEAGRGVAEALLKLEALRYGPPGVGPAHQARDGWNGWWQDFQRRSAALQATRRPAR